MSKFILLRSLKYYFYKKYTKKLSSLKWAKSLNVENLNGSQPHRDTVDRVTEHLWTVNINTETVLNNI